MKFQIGSFVNHGKKKKPRLCLLYMHECMYKNSFCDQKNTKYKTSVIDPCVKKYWTSHCYQPWSPTGVEVCRIMF